MDKAETFNMCIPKALKIALLKDAKSAKHLSKRCMTDVIWAAERMKSLLSFSRFSEQDADRHSSLTLKKSKCTLQHLQYLFLVCNDVIKHLN